MVTNEYPNIKIEFNFHELHIHLHMLLSLPFPKHSALPVTTFYVTLSYNGFVFFPWVGCCSHTPCFHDVPHTVAMAMISIFQHEPLWLQVSSARLFFFQSLFRDPFFLPHTPNSALNVLWLMFQSLTSIVTC